MKSFTLVLSVFAFLSLAACTTGEAVDTSATYEADVTFSNSLRK